MTRVADKTVLITGSAMGMGRLHAERAVERQAGHLVLWDVQEAPLMQTAEDLRRMGARVHPQVVDIADPDAVASAADHVLGEVGPVHVVFNNAGVVVPGDFVSHTQEDIEKIIRINTLGVMHVAHAFLPAMIESSEAHLVNIASASSLMPLPYGSVYAASKWAVYCWSESVRLELKSQGHDHVHVTTVCPSFVATGMFEGAKPPRLTRFLRTEEIVDAVWNAMERNRIVVVEPAAARLVMPLRGLLPIRWFDFLAERVFGTYSAMKGLRGRRALSPGPPVGARG